MCRAKDKGCFRMNMASLLSTMPGPVLKTSSSLEVRRAGCRQGKMRRSLLRRQSSHKPTMLPDLTGVELSWLTKANTSHLVKCWRYLQRTKEILGKLLKRKQTLSARAQARKRRILPRRLVQFAVSTPQYRLLLVQLHVSLRTKDQKKRAITAVKALEKTRM